MSAAPAVGALVTYSGLGVEGEQGGRIAHVVTEYMVDDEDPNPPLAMVSVETEDTTYFGVMFFASKPADMPSQACWPDQP